MMGHPIMLSTTQVRNWVTNGGGWCPFCQSEQIKYTGTLRAINGITTVKYFCQRCQRTHYAIYSGDQLVDLTHDEISFGTD
jgi:hypothetical protein